MPNANNFITSSDFNLDIVAKIISGNFSFIIDYNSADGGFYKIAHGLNFTPLVSGFWSMNQNFQPAYSFGCEYFNPNDETGAADFGILAIGADRQYIWFQPTNQNAYKTYYFKVYCLVPNYLESNIGMPNLNNFKKFIFNSDFSYLKLKNDGIITIPSAEHQETGNTITVNHNLGYLPFVRSWSNTPSVSGVYWLNNAHTFMKNIIDNNTVKFSNSKYSKAMNVIYRIYADEA